MGVKLKSVFRCFTCDGHVCGLSRSLGHSSGSLDLQTHSFETASPFRSYVTMYKKTFAAKFTHDKAEKFRSATHARPHRLQSAPPRGPRDWREANTGALSHALRARELAEKLANPSRIDKILKVYFKLSGGMADRLRDMSVDALSDWVGSAFTATRCSPPPRGYVEFHKPDVICMFWTVRHSKSRPNVSARDIIGFRS